MPYRTLLRRFSECRRKRRFGISVLNLNRNVSSAEFSIYNEDGDVVYHDTSGGPMQKTMLYEGLLTSYYIYIWDCTAIDNYYYTYPDGKYRVELH